MISKNVQQKLEFKVELQLNLGFLEMNFCIIVIDAMNL